MRKFLVFLVGLAGLAMSISGCVAGAYKNTLVKDNYIHKYVKKNADIKPKKVGDSNVKFYVVKIEDNRTTKYIYRKLGIATLPAGKTKLDNATATLANLTKKALIDTGWGISDNNIKADYFVNIKLNSLGLYNYFFTFYRKTNALIAIRNTRKKIVIKKIVKKYTPVIFGGIDTSSQFKFIAAQSCVDYYTLLVKFFSSTDFKNAIMQDYFLNLNNTTDNTTIDNSTNSSKQE